MYRPVRSQGGRLFVVHEPNLKCTIVIMHRRRASVNNLHFDLFSRTVSLILIKLGRDGVLMVPYKNCFRSDPPRVGLSMSSRGSFFDKLLQTESSKASETIRMHCS